MRNTNAMRMTLTWDGKEYQCLADMAACMRIEERVVLHVLADRVIRGASSVPSSHACWVLYCLLERAGAPATADDVYEAAKGGLVNDETFKTVLTWLIGEVYGRPDNDIEASAPKKPSPRRRPLPKRKGKSAAAK